MNILVQNHNQYTTAKAIIFRGKGERNREYALLMKVIKPETALYIQCSHFFSSPCVTFIIMVELVYVLQKTSYYILYGILAIII